jgi:hypothetical protein
MTCPVSASVRVSRLGVPNRCLHFTYFSRGSSAAEMKKIMMRIAYTVCCKRDKISAFIYCNKLKM